VVVTVPGAVVVVAVGAAVVVVAASAAVVVVDWRRAAAPFIELLPAAALTARGGGRRRDAVVGATVVAARIDGSRRGRIGRHRCVGSVGSVTVGSAAVAAAFSSSTICVDGHALGDLQLLAQRGDLLVGVLRRRGRRGRQHRPEPQLGGLADEVEDPLLVLDARQLDDDRRALDRDVGFTDADRVHTGLDDPPVSARALPG
jgi:hypothetical protein